MQQCLLHGLGGKKMAALLPLPSLSKPLEAGTVTIHQEELHCKESKDYLP
jgi:hypothetical protein